ncbi:RING-type E3 ubiquitin transferase [Ranunculus cassubicifolius]
MAHNSELPCDGDGICMVCKIKPNEQDTLSCKTCTTDWHLNCLSSSETLDSTLDWWECPDCAAPVVNDVVLPSIVVSESGDLIAEIRAIEADEKLSEKEKAKKRQDLLSRGAGHGGDDEEEIKEKDRDVDVFDGSFNCSFCMQLPERPVTTPCGHNFCLKCFQKWTGQGKRTCAKCRTAIPSKMASQPRINASLVVAIRMARMSKSQSNVSTVKPLKVYHFIDNMNRPDKAFTTERAKKTGLANACSGKIFVTVPSDHFGPILAENDPERNQGVLVGETWEDRMECRQWGAHLPHVAGIAGQSDYGAQSVALSGGYEDDEDHGEWFLYTGSGGRDLSGNKRTNKEQSFDQKFEKYNEALRVSCRKGYPVRVVRSHKEKRSCYAPESGVRYDGVYRIEKCWRKVGIQGFKVCRYLFVRCDNEPAPWTSDEHGDKVRPLPVIKELKKATDVTDRTGKPSWDYDEVEDCWKWKTPPPASRMKKITDNGNQNKLRPIENMSAEDMESERARRAAEQKQKLSAKEKLFKEKLLKEFSCLICRKVMTLPITTPCAHNFCKHCLEDAFAGQTLLKERTCGGRRTLRTQKNIMKCPSCPMEISDFLQNPQVNRDLMGVIESLKSQLEEDKIEDPSNEESLSTEDKSESEVSTDKSEVVESGEENVIHKCSAKEGKVDVIDDKLDQKSPLKKCANKGKRDRENEEDELHTLTESKSKRKKAGMKENIIDSGSTEMLKDGNKAIQNSPTTRKQSQKSPLKKSDNTGKNASEMPENENQAIQNSPGKPQKSPAKRAASKGKKDSEIENKAIRKSPRRTQISPVKKAATKGKKPSEVQENMNDDVQNSPQKAEKSPVKKAATKGKKPSEMHENVIEDVQNCPQKTGKSPVKKAATKGKKPSEMHENVNEDIQNSPQKTRKSPVKKAAAASKGKRARDLKTEIPETCEIQASTDEGRSVQSGARTRSMRSKVQVDEKNDPQTKKLPSKRKKAKAL